MRQRAREAVNRGYGWLERNPVTGMLVSGGLSALAVVAVVALGIYSQKTFVAKSACTKDVSSAACAKIREEVARAEPLTNPCISHQRVEGTKGRNCPRFFVPRPGQLQANSKSVQDLERGSNGGLAPAPGGRAGGPAPGSTGDSGGLSPHTGRGKPDRDTSPKPPASDGGGKDSPDSVVKSPADSGSASTDTPDGNSTGSPEATPEQASGPLGDLTGSVGGAVHEVGKGLDKAACPALDRLAGLCSALSP
jgi:hypothetical protein